VDLATRRQKWIGLLVGTVIARGKADYRDDDVVQTLPAGKKDNSQYTQNQPCFWRLSKSGASTKAEESSLT